MSTFTLQEAPDNYQGDVRRPWPIIEEDTILEALLLEIKEDEKPFKDDNGNPVVKLAWTFQATVDGQDRRFWGDTGIEFVEHEDCKLYTWASEMLANSIGSDTLPRGFQLNTTHLIGEPCRIMMGVRSYIPKSVEQVESNRKYVNFVKDVMRPRGSTMTTSAAPAFADDPF